MQTAEHKTKDSPDKVCSASGSLDALNDVTESNNKSCCSLVEAGDSQKICKRSPYSNSLLISEDSLRQHECKKRLHSLTLTYLRGEYGI